MKTKETWDFAHQYVGKLWLFFGSFIAVITVILMILFRNSRIDTIGQMAAVWCLLQCLGLAIPIIPTELALKKQFDEDGFRKKIL